MAPPTAAGAADVAATNRWDEGVSQPGTVAASHAIGMAVTVPARETTYTIPPAVIGVSRGAPPRLKIVVGGQVVCAQVVGKT